MLPDIISLQIPQLDAVDAVPVADGCSNNDNYYTSGGSRSTCCCGCDKVAIQTNVRGTVPAVPRTSIGLTG